MVTKTVAKKQEFTMKEVFALWKRESKNGNPYFTGKSAEGINLRGFFNTNKKNPKEPDLKVYVHSEGELAKEPLISMWCNVGKTGKKYLTGKIGEQRVVGFISDGKNEKAPYLRCYYSDDSQQRIEETTEEPKKSDNLPF